MRSLTTIAPLDAQFEPRLLRQMALRCHANGKQHHIGSDRVIARNMGDNAAINFLKTCHIGLEAQIDTVLTHLGMQKGRHVVIQVVHKLDGTLQKGHLEPQLTQILRRLDANEAAADHDGTARSPLSNIAVNTQRVLNGA